MYFLQGQLPGTPVRAALPVAFACGLLVGCAGYRSPARVSETAVAELGAAAARGPRSGAWPAEPRDLERALAGELEVLAVEDIDSGLSHPLRVTLDSGVLGGSLDAKWKRAPNDLEVINNSPRKEIAAYELQKLVLAPPDYVVPTTVLACLPPDALPGHLLEPQPMVPGPCVVGELQAWLRDVEVPERKVETARFWRDPVYAYHVADLNLVTILMDHSDTHRDNLLQSTEAANRMLFSVDNGISFGSWFRNPFVRDWNRVRVPALRAESIERLRAITRDDLDRLGVVAQLECTERTCRSVEPGPNLAPREGVRVEGSIVQLGLTTDEIDGVWRRRERLLRAVDSGRVAVFPPRTPSDAPSSPRRAPAPGPHRAPVSDIFLEPRSSSQNHP